MHLQLTILTIFQGIVCFSFGQLGVEAPAISNDFQLKGNPKMVKQTRIVHNDIKIDTAYSTYLFDSTAYLEYCSVQKRGTRKPVKTLYILSDKKYDTIYQDNNTHTFNYAANGQISSENVRIINLKFSISIEGSVVYKQDRSENYLAYEYKYDRKNRLVKIQVSNPDSVDYFANRIRFKYNSKGQITRKTIDHEDRIDTYRYAYNKDGSLKQLTHSENDDLRETTNYFYENGVLIREESMDGLETEEYVINYENALESSTYRLEIWNDNRESTSNTSYIYDEHGSWIKKTCTFSEGEQIIVMRDIEYY